MPSLVNMMAGPSSLLSGVLSYNAMSLKQVERVHDKAHVLGCGGVLCLQGTREAVVLHPVAYCKGLGFHRFPSGYGKRSNRHAGVAIFCLTRSPLKQWSVWLGLLMPLCKEGLWQSGSKQQSDLVIACACFPPLGSGAARAALQVTQRLYMWWHKLLRGLPHRVVPFLRMLVFAMCPSAPIPRWLPRRQMTIPQSSTTQTWMAKTILDRWCSPCRSVTF